MTNTQKAVLRRIAAKVLELKQEAETLCEELDEYISDHQDTLDGTARGEKLDNEMEAVYALGDTFDMLHGELVDVVEGNF